MAARAGAALLADLATVPEGDAAFWQALRESPLANSGIGLGSPRVLARLPHGKKTDPISSFSFEELPPRAGVDPVHRVLGQRRLRAGTGSGRRLPRRRLGSWHPGAAFELDELPAHTYDDDGESRYPVPTIEVAAAERAAAAIVQA